MTDNRKFKEVIRQRMAKTDESYTTAKMNLEAQRPSNEGTAKAGGKAPPAVPGLPPAEEKGVGPTLCPACRVKPANPNEAYLLCDRCSLEKAGFDHSPDYWD